MLLVAARSGPAASRMAMRFARAGSRVAALYPTKTHPLAVTRAVSSHHVYSSIDPVGSLLAAIGTSAAELAIPCDGLAVRHLHTLFANLPSTPEGRTVAAVIERSLGDSTAYLVIDSRHEIQTTARIEGVRAAESFAIGRATDPETLAQSLPFPWVMKADYSWGGRGARVVRNLREARAFARKAGAPPSLAMAAKQLMVNKDRAALGEWLHAKRTNLSAQRPLAGRLAAVSVACWRGAVLAQIAVEVISPEGYSGPPAVVRMVEIEQMNQTVKRMTDRLGLSGFHGFDFILDDATGQALLTGFNSHCGGPAHLNAGPGHDLVDAFYRKWVNASPVTEQPLHPGPTIAYFPQAWAANPDDPILQTPAYDVPKDEPEFVECMMRLVKRDRSYLSFKSKVRTLTGRKSHG